MAIIPDDATNMYLRMERGTDGWRCDVILDAYQRGKSDERLDRWAHSLDPYGFAQPDLHANHSDRIRTASDGTLVRGSARFLAEQAELDDWAARGAVVIYDKEHEHAVALMNAALCLSEDDRRYRPNPETVGIALARSGKPRVDQPVKNYAIAVAQVDKALDAQNMQKKYFCTHATALVAMGFDYADVIPDGIETYRMRSGVYDMADVSRWTRGLRVSGGMVVPKEDEVLAHATSRPSPDAPVDVAGLDVESCLS